MRPDITHLLAHNQRQLRRGVVPGPLERDDDSHLADFDLGWHIDTAEHERVGLIVLKAGKGRASDRRLLAAQASRLKQHGQPLRPFVLAHSANLNGELMLAIVEERNGKANGHARAVGGEVLADGADAVSVRPLRTASAVMSTAASEGTRQPGTNTHLVAHDDGHK